MTLTEQRQHHTDDEFARHEARQANHRFSVLDETPVPIRKQPKRYSFFKSADEARADPIIGPMMDEEDERELKGKPARFCLL